MSLSVYWGAYFYHLYVLILPLSFFTLISSPHTVISSPVIMSGSMNNSNQAQKFSVLYSFPRFNRGEYLASSMRYQPPIHHSFGTGMYFQVIIMFDLDMKWHIEVNHHSVNHTAKSSLRRVNKDAFFPSSRCSWSMLLRRRNTVIVYDGPWVKVLPNICF